MRIEDIVVRGGKWIYPSIYSSIYLSGWGDDETSWWNFKCVCDKSSSKLTSNASWWINEKKWKDKTEST